MCGRCWYCKVSKMRFPLVDGKAPIMDQAFRQVVSRTHPTAWLVPCDMPLREAWRRRDQVFLRELRELEISRPRVSA